MENLMQYLPFLIPILVIEIGLAAVALVHIFQHSSYRAFLLGKKRHMDVSQMCGSFPLFGKS